MYSNTAFRFAAVLAAGAIVVACAESDNEVLGPRPTGADAIFQNYVALGNSITAGYQSSGINDSTQRRSYASLLAQQMGVAHRYPRLFGRGCVPPVIDFATQQRFGTGSTSSTCDGRAQTTSDLLNNVAVPGAAVADLTDADGTSNSNTLTSLFLAGKSQVQKALDVDPTFVSIWIGNNDVLPAAVSGILVPAAGISPGVTAQTAFTASYDAATDALIQAEPDLKGVLIGVVHVTNAPIFFRAALLLPAIATNPVYAAFNAATGYNATGTPGQQVPVTVDANCSPTSTALVSFRIVSQIALFRANPAATGAHPPHIACSAPATGYPAPVGEIFILSDAEVTALTDAVNAYNTYIQQEATTLNFAYVNPNVLLDSLRTVDQIPIFPDLLAPTHTFHGLGCTSPACTWVSLDGVHPSDRSHRAITNHIIDAVNAKYGTSLPRVTVN